MLRISTFTDLSSSSMDFIYRVYISLRGDVQQSVARTSIHNQNKNRPQSKINWLRSFKVKIQHHKSWRLFHIYLAEKSWTMEALHDGIRSVNSGFGNSADLANSGSLTATTGNISPRGSHIFERRCENTAGARALREPQQLGLVG